MASSKADDIKTIDASSDRPITWQEYRGCDQTWW